jgi:GH43 family beta-xylosidase
MTDTTIRTPAGTFSPAVTFRNPLMADGGGADPWMVWHDGFYYLTATSGDGIRVRRAASITELADAPDTLVWRDDTPSRRAEMWAPEFYLLDGPNGRRWYLYYTAGDGVADANHRAFVLESLEEGDTSTPLGPYAFKAQLATDPRDALYAIDAGLIQRGDGALFCVWAGHPHHRLFISAMENPWTLVGERRRLDADGFGCPEVREGPVALRRNGRIFLIYSMCDTGKPDYRLGMLIAEEGADLMNPASWKQHPEVVFGRNDAAGVYGPGHNGFFHSPDGSETWIVYHAKDTAEYTYERRLPRAQRVEWNDAGEPVLGVPLSLDTDIPVPSGDPASGDPM